MIDHPITPPPELIKQWYMEATGPDYEGEIARRAAQWGADEELEACCEWLQDPDLNVDTYKLRASRRPNPPSLKEQSLKHLDVMERDGYYLPEILQDLRRAVDQLDD